MSVLYQNAERTIALIDIPASIAQAQGTALSPWTKQLLSCEPLKVPFPSLEPKQPANASNGGHVESEDQDDAAAIARLIEEALREIAQHTDRWCLPRIVGSARERQLPPQKRKSEWDGPNPPSDFSAN